MATGVVDGVEDRYRQLAAALSEPWHQRLLDDLAAGLFVGSDRVLTEWLDVGDVPLISSGLPAMLADCLFGDDSRVYDCAHRLTSPGIFSARTALNGAAPGFAKPPGTTLSRFIESHNGAGVVVLDDVQAFDVSAIECLAQIVENGLACPEGSSSPTLPAGGLVVLARLRIPLPSPATLARHAGLTGMWRLGDKPPDEFEAAVAAHASALYPNHLRDWVMVRLRGLRCDLAWTRACALIEAGREEAEIFTAPAQVPVPASPEGLPPHPHNLVSDVSTISDDPPDPGRFDVFVGYSWARHSDEAAWLAERLRAAGYEVFFDKDQIDLDDVPAHGTKEFLIRKLRWAVRSSRARIVFAAQLRPYLPTPGFDQAAALRRGLAMTAPGDLIVEWNWQALELDASRRHLVFGDGIAYASSEEVPYRPISEGRIRDRSEIETLARVYLDAEGIRPRRAPG